MSAAVSYAENGWAAALPKVRRIVLAGAVFLLGCSVGSHAPTGPAAAQNAGFVGLAVWARPNGAPLLYALSASGDLWVTTDGVHWSRISNVTTSTGSN